MAVGAGGAVLTALALDRLRGNGEAGPSTRPTAKTGRPQSQSVVAYFPALSRGRRLRARAEKPFTIEVPDGWQRQGPDTAKKFVFVQGAYQLVVVAGRDLAGPYDGDPVDYQLAEPELAAFRSSEWSSASGLEEGSPCSISEGTPSRAGHEQEGRGRQPRQPLGMYFLSMWGDRGAVPPCGRGRGSGGIRSRRGGGVRRPGFRWPAR